MSPLRVSTSLRPTGGPRSDGTPVGRTRVTGLSLCQVPVERRRV